MVDKGIALYNDTVPYWQSIPVVAFNDTVAGANHYFKITNLGEVDRLNVLEITIDGVVQNLSDPMFVYTGTWTNGTGKQTTQSGATLAFTLNCNGVYKEVTIKVGAHNSAYGCRIQQYAV